VEPRRFPSRERPKRRFPHARNSFFNSDCVGASNKLGRPNSAKCALKEPDILPGDVVRRRVYPAGA